MRRAFIALGIAVFLVYCWASVVYQNRVGIPDYRLVEVDLLGKPRAAWDADPQGQFQRLMELETKNYQLPPDTRVKAKQPEGGKPNSRVHADADGNIPVDSPLNSDDFAWIIANAPAGQPVVMKLRDTGAIYELLGHNYLLRDNIDDPADPDGNPLFVGGRPLDKAMLDVLRAKGFRTITVSGHGAPVNFQVGTSLMVAIIFLTLVAALKPVLWGPFLALLEKRRHELEVGSEAERQNQLEATRFQDESRRRHAELTRNIRELHLRGQRDIAVEAGNIVKSAREKEKAVKLRGLQEVGLAAAKAEEEMRSRIPELAEAVAEALTPGRSPRWGTIAKDRKPQDRDDE